MGQFGNQPDFATNNIKEIAPTDVISLATKLNSSVIYIGDNTGDVMIVIPSGIQKPTEADAVVFKGLQAGGFLPVTVDYVLATKGADSTTVGSLIAAR